MVAPMVPPITKPKVQQSEWRTFDRDGDGKLDEFEVRALEERLKDDDRMIGYLKHTIVILIVGFLIQVPETYQFFDFFLRLCVSRTNV